MSGTFWISEKDLDAEQASAVQGMGGGDSFLVRGPAGSGKTNILLLRAKWLRLKKLSEFRIIVFTASLREFVRTGCVQYGIPAETAITAIRFFRDFLSEYGVDFELTGQFEADRALLAGKVQSLIEERKISNTYDALLIDECQDYMDTELLIFRRLAKRLVLVADSRQSIYRATHTPGLLEKLVDERVINLRYHYRSGVKLCAVADAILRDSANFAPLAGECKYDESTRPSSVTVQECADLNEQFEAILNKLPGQLALYPKETIGVLFPKKDQEEAFEGKFAQLEMAEKDRVHVNTIHGAKGWEFRAIHVAGCEALYRMGSVQKRLTYTGLLRGRTSAAFYFSGSIPGYLESALAVLAPPKPDPNLSELF